MALDWEQCTHYSKYLQRKNSNRFWPLFFGPNAVTFVDIYKTHYYVSSFQVRSHFKINAIMDQNLRNLWKRGFWPHFGQVIWKQLYILWCIETCQLLKFQYIWPILAYFLHSLRKQIYTHFGLWKSNLLKYYAILLPFGDPGHIPCNILCSMFRW